MTAIKYLIAGRSAVTEDNGQILFERLDDFDIFGLDRIGDHVDALTIRIIFLGRHVEAEFRERIGQISALNSPVGPCQFPTA